MVSIVGNGDFLFPLAIMVTSFKRTYASMLWLPGLLYSGPLPCSRPLLAHAPTGDSWTHTGKSGSIPCGVTAAFSWLLVSTRVFCASKSLFPQSNGSSVIKSHWPSKSNSLGVLSPFTRSPGWEICCGP